MVVSDWLVALVIIEADEARVTTKPVRHNLESATIDHLFKPLIRAETGRLGAAT